MPKSLKNILDGVKKSKIVPGSTGSDPGVDYAPKAPNEQEFVKKHKREKHEDRVGNGDDIYQATNIKHSQADEPKHGYKKPQDKNVNEAAKCNMTEEGVSCPVHEMADCSKATKTLREVAKNPYAIGMAAAMKSTGDKPPLAKSTIVKAHDIAKSIKKEDLAVPLLDDGNDDESAEMAKTQLRALANKALHLAMQLGDEQVVEPWIQAKIAVAKDNVTAVHDYMVYGEHSKSKENEQTAPYEGGIDMSGAPRNSYPDFSADVNTGRVV
jgi:translation elongation factor EF-G